MRQPTDLPCGVPAVRTDPAVIIPKSRAFCNPQSALFRRLPAIFRNFLFSALSRLPAFRNARILRRRRLFRGVPAAFPVPLLCPPLAEQAYLPSTVRRRCAIMSTFLPLTSRETARRTCVSFSASNGAVTSSSDTTSAFPGNARAIGMRRSLPHVPIRFRRSFPLFQNSPAENESAFPKKSALSVF